MRRVLFVLIVMCAAVSAEPVRKPSMACEVVADRVAQVIGGDHAQLSLIAQRCDRDRWSLEAQSCFGSSANDRDAGRCLDKLTKDQQRLLAGDADRLPADTRSRRFAAWLARRPQTSFVGSPPTIFALAADTTSNLPKARALHDQGMSAYEAGHYDIAVRKFSAAKDASPNPELLYHLGQAYRLKGDWTNALELYEKYLEIAPNGPAAADCSRQIEKLIEQLP